MDRYSILTGETPELPKHAHAKATTISPLTGGVTNIGPVTFTDTISWNNLQKLKEELSRPQTGHILMGNRHQMQVITSKYINPGTIMMINGETLGTVMGWKPPLPSYDWRISNGV